MADHFTILRQPFTAFCLVPVLLIASPAVYRKHGTNFHISAGISDHYPLWARQI